MQTALAFLGVSLQYPAVPDADRFIFHQNFLMIFEKAAPDTQSEIGIEYHQHFSGPLRQILMAGEREWLNNAASVYAWQSPEVWENRILPHLMQGKLQNEDYDDMIRFCPQMLAALSRQRITTTKDRTLIGILAALK